MRRPRTPGPMTASRRRAARRAWVLVAACAVLAACGHLPEDPVREPSHALSRDTRSPIGDGLRPLLAQRPGESVFHPLGNGLDAFVARLAFADAARRSIDVQYYLFHDDLTGRSLTAYLLRAADRGVRVRILLDDMDMNGRDAGLASIALHPNIAIRLFNPFPSRSFRYLDFVTHFGTVSRRMHNKAFIVDNHVAIVGGRNIGDEYFEAADGTNFGDMDLLAAGPIVGAVSDSFDLYWNSDLAYPVRALGASGDPRTLERARVALEAELEDFDASPYARRLRESNLATALKEKRVSLYWSEARLLYDLPGKVRADPEDRSTHLGPELDALLESARTSLTAISPYFVPGKRGTRLLTDLAERGVEVTVITNSLASTDVPAVHAGYVRYRRRLLEAGIALYETRPTRDEDTAQRLGSSQSSLHAKTFVIDGKIVVVGSMNLDPRSDLLNTEMGIVIESPDLAGEVETWRRNELPKLAWRVTLRDRDETTGAPSGPMQWMTRGDEDETPAPGREPDAGLGRRLVAALLRWMPIERQL